MLVLSEQLYPVPLYFVTIGKDLKISLGWDPWEYGWDLYKSQCM